MSRVTGTPRLLAIVVGLAVATFGGYLLATSDKVPWWGATIICMTGLAIALPNRMLAIWAVTKDKLPGGS